MHVSNHPLWLVGFRPFFTLACLAGMLLPVLWALIFSGHLPAPESPFTSVQWHAHEMFFGFGWAVLGGFLLTSTKNWVNIRGYHGLALMWLAAAWIIERIGMSFGGTWPMPLFLLVNNLFLGSIIAMLLWTLIRHRNQDSYRDNAFFMVLLPAFLVAKYLMLAGGDFTAGYSMAIALFRLAFLVMLERTLTGFMKAAFQAQILRHPVLDMAIKLLGLLLVIEFVLPRSLTAVNLATARRSARHPLFLLEAATGLQAHRCRHHVRRLSGHRWPTLDRSARPCDEFCLGRLGIRPSLHLRCHGLRHSSHDHPDIKGPHRAQGGL